MKTVKGNLTVWFDLTCCTNKEAFKIRLTWTQMIIITDALEKVYLLDDYKRKQ